MSSERKYVLITRKLLREVRNVNTKLTEVLDAPNPFKWNNISDADLIEEVANRGFEIKSAVIHKKWVNLTDEEISEVLGSDIYSEPSGELRFIRAIESKLKEKNT